MRHIISLAMMAAVAALSSCIQDEPANVEADIEKVYFSPEDTEKLTVPAMLKGSEILLFINDEAGTTVLAPHFELSPGARISPASGTELDFVEPQLYTVTSEDGKWSKRYTMRVASDIVLKYGFETYDNSKGYTEFYEELTDDQGNVAQRQNIWASGNPGAKMGLSGASASGYPTYAAEGEGRPDKVTDLPSTAAKLTTVKMSKFVAGLGKPIAAGNLFIGTFNLLAAMGDSKKATDFGYPINKKPKAFKGWYKYKSGTADYEGNQYPPDQPDSCRIYAVLYKSENGEKLNGHSILTSPNVVATAIFEAPAQTDEWAPFENEPGAGEIGFTYRTEVGADEIANSGKYNIALVFSSSYRGDEFIGAINSTLYIDDVEITYDE